MSTTQTVKTGRRIDIKAPTQNEEHMFEFLNSRVIGQAEACRAAVRIKTRALSPLKRSGCAGFYAFQGEPGVGKTELVKTICQYLHGDPNAFVLIDGGLLQDDAQVSSLTGAPPMYVGYEDPDKAKKRRDEEAKALEKLRAEHPELAAKYKTFNPRKLLTRENLVKSRGNSKVPLSIVFIDEADKMNPRVDDIFLNGVVNGFLMMSDNEIVEVGDVVFIIAGNHGSTRVVSRKQPIGFRQESVAEEHAEARDLILNAMKERHRPEFLDRIDEIIFFNKLQPEDLKRITSLRIEEVVNAYYERMPRGTAFTVRVENSARDFIYNEAMKANGNARRIGRAVKQHFEDDLARLISKLVDNAENITIEDLLVVSHREGAPELDWDVFEDEGVPADGDKLIQVRPDTPVSQIFLGRERVRKTLKLKAKGSTKQVYKVVIASQSKDEMTENFRMFGQELREILELPLVSFEMAFKAPWVLTLFVECTVDQSKLLEEHFDGDGVVTVTDRKPSDDAAA
ncbi:MAG: AAA family ATPase [Candidatus Obscuribacterales bacterium]|nr:AAA family ATPase [Candidatus Obscuribacterales bacterium]